MQGFYSETWSKTQTGSKHQQTGITQARQRVFLGQAWVFDQQTMSRGLDKRGNPNNTSKVQARCKHNPKQQGKGLNSRYTGKNQVTGKTRQDKTRLDYELRLGKLDWFRKVAIARRVICAKQYSAKRKRKSMAYVECVIGCSRVRNQSEMDCGN